MIDKKSNLIDEVTQYLQIKESCGTFENPDCDEGENCLSFHRRIKKDYLTDYYHLEQQLFPLANHNSCTEDYFNYQVREQNVPEHLHKLDENDHKPKTVLDARLGTINVTHSVVDLSVANRYIMLKQLMK